MTDSSPRVRPSTIETTRPGGQCPSCECRNNKRRTAAADCRSGRVHALSSIPRRTLWRCRRGIKWLLRPITYIIIIVLLLFNITYCFVIRPPRNTRNKNKSPGIVLLLLLLRSDIILLLRRRGAEIRFPYRLNCFYSQQTVSVKSVVVPYRQILFVVRFYSNIIIIDTIRTLVVDDGFYEPRSTANPATAPTIIYHYGFSYGRG